MTTSAATATRHDENPNGRPPGELLTIEEAAARLKMSVRFMRRLVADRRIPFHRLGRSVRFDPDDLAVFVKAGRIEPITPETVWRDSKETV